MMRPPPQVGSVGGIQSGMGAMSVGRGGNAAGAGFHLQPQTFQAPPPPGGAFPGAAPPPAASTFQPPSSNAQQTQPNFYGQQPTDTRPNQFNGQRGTPSGPPQAIPNPPQPGEMGGAGQAPNGDYADTADLSIQIPRRFLRMTTKSIPQSANLANSSKIAIGGVMRPLAPTGFGEEEIDVVNPRAAGIVRCKRCRTYVNAFVTWIENGRRWRCNICTQLNECPSAYFCHLDNNGLRRDRLQRPELSKGIVEYIAPSEYMVRPPQPPTYFFVIDVSSTAVNCGMLSSLTAAVKKSLDDLPGGPRTQIGFITYDNSVHYYDLKSGLSNPQMMVVADLKELFVPAPEDLLVNLLESRSVVDSFLDHLPQMFSKTQVTESCLGPALKAAFTVTKHIGGKMLVFQTTLPTLGDGALKPRENFRTMGTPDEVKMLNPEIVWYKDTAVEFSRSQISVDMFLFPYQYIDTAALSQLPKLTAGTLRTYAGFDPIRDGPMFESTLTKHLTQKTAFEAVMRIRCTRGMCIKNFYGNFFIRGTDLLSLPNCNEDSVYSFDMAHDEQNTPSNIITVQSALLYTSSEGERRIRVFTQALPVTSLMSELAASVDTETMCNLMAKQASILALKSTLENGRNRLQQTCIDIVRAAKGGDQRVGYAPQLTQQEEKEIPPNLQLLPLYTMALMKNVAFRGGTDIHPDERVQAIQLLANMWVSDSKYFMYPRMFSIHDMDHLAGKPSENEVQVEDSNVYAGRNHVCLPKVVNLSVERLSSDGIFLLDNGVEMFVWVGRTVDAGVMMNLFGLESLEGLDTSQVS